MEEIFDKIAKQEMTEWQLKGFKKSYPTLFKVIIKAMEEASKPPAPVEVYPNFCFICGSKLERAGSRYFQCSSENCGEVFYASIHGNTGNKTIMHIRTPYTPKSK